MKLLHSWNKFNSLSSSKPVSYYSSSRVLRVLSYSTETLKPSPPSNSTSNETLLKKISPAGDNRFSIVPILDKWVEEGNTITRDQLLSTIKQLKNFRRFKHALEMSQWMTKRKYFNFTPALYASRLDLISKVEGVEQAEKYFESIPEKSKTSPTYDFQKTKKSPAYEALLNCYVRHKSVEKAVALMQEMRDLGFASTSVSYNFMLNLYYQVGQYEKLDTLMLEMKEKGIPWDKFTFMTRMRAYAATSDIRRMEMILNKMEEDHPGFVDWNSYAVAANGYIKAGLKDKALIMLKKLEKQITGKKRSVAYDSLLTLYTSIGKKEELYRIWYVYKSLGKVYLPGYACMINSLLKLDDISGAEKIFEEWESEGTYDGFWVPTLLILAYCRKGHLEKAEKLVKEAVERGKMPRPNTWDALATGYLENNKIQEAVETMKKGILARRPGWKPNRVTLSACLEYMKANGDVEGAQEFEKLLGSSSNYIEDGNAASLSINEMDEINEMEENGSENGLDDIDEANIMR